MSAEHKPYVSSEASTGREGETDEPTRLPEPPTNFEAPEQGASSFVPDGTYAPTVRMVPATPVGIRQIGGSGEMIPREGGADPRPAPGEEGGGPMRLSYRHRAIMDLMLSQPGMKLGAIATALGYTQSWVSTVVNNDLFRMELAHRRASFEHEQHARITSRLLNVANTGVGIMEDMLTNGSPEEITPNVVNTFTELALKSLGYIGKSGPTINVNAPTQVNNLRVAKDDLLEAQAIINRLHGVLPAAA